MAKEQLNVNFYQNTVDENKKILLKLRGRNKIDNKTPDEWNKLFAKLNNNINNNSNSNKDKTISDDDDNNGNGKKQKKNSKITVTRQDQVVIEPIYGPVPGFSSGHWWGIRMDCSRDQVHNPFDKDIQEGPFGVVSICTSHLNTTNDVDLGTLLTFTGSEYNPDKVTDPLMENYRNNIPLRLIRSYNLTNEFAPNTGYRYDGLYIVTSWWIGLSSNSKSYYKFSLARLNYQELPPWSLPSKRTSQRISSVLRNVNAKVKNCGTLKCHMDSCQTEKPEKKKRKISHDRKILSTAMNVNGVCLNKSNDINESTIVMRHVSKKCDTTGAGQNINIPGVKLPIPMGNLMLPCSPKTSVCKLQNTNISIRTELYDSSPNAQQDVKKITPMTLCRIYKTNHVSAAKMINDQTTNAVGTINLNVFGPCIKDKMNQESQIQSRSRINNISNTPNLNATNCTIEKPSNDCNVKNNHSKAISDGSIKNNSLVCNSNNNIEILNTKLNDDTDDLNDCLANKLKNSDGTTVNSKNNSNTSLSSTELSMKQIKIPEAMMAIEKMTPEQLLNFIVKRRYNPTGKLLIGSIIGLPVENLMQTSELPAKLINNLNHSAHLDNNGKTNTIKMSETREEEIKSHNKKIYKSQSNLTAGPLKKTVDKNVDRRMRFRRLRPSRVENASVTIKDSNINCNKNSSKRLNKVQIQTSDKVKQPYSKSTSGTKKRRELANLVIDANFSTKFRGHTIQTRTMSRRLRSTTIILSKRKEFKGFITNYSRVDLSKKTKRLKSGKKVGIPKNQHIQQEKCEENIENIKRTTRKSMKPDVRTIQNEKRKTLISQRNKIQNNSKKIERSKSRMVDAMTQCTLQKDVSTSIEKNLYSNEQHSDDLMKIKWVDFVNDVKLENEANKSLEESGCDEIQMSDNSKSLQKNNSKKSKTFMKSLNNQSNTINSKTLTNEAFNRLSAFVPVNIPDGELRVARLRSIGFKPIKPYQLNNNETLNIRIDNDRPTGGNEGKPTVIRRKVDEQYNKYTSEESNVVGYMDNELHYQDIEAEASELQKINEIIRKQNYTRIRGRKLIANKVTQRAKQKLNAVSFEQEVDEEKRPWLGWNSYVAKH